MAGTMRAAVAACGGARIGGTITRLRMSCFLASAASLANRTTGAQRAEYLGWAKKEWNWFSHSGMINEKHLINDGLNKECKNNGAKIWSYNQGVILGGLVELHKADHDPSLLTQANEIAQATIANLTDTEWHFAGWMRESAASQQSGRAKLRRRCDAVQGCLCAEPADAGGC